MKIDNQVPKYRQNKLGIKVDLVRVEICCYENRALDVIDVLFTFDTFVYNHSFDDLYSWLSVHVLAFSHSGQDVVVRVSRNLGKYDKSRFIDTRGACQW